MSLLYIWVFIRGRMLWTKVIEKKNADFTSGTFLEIRKRDAMCTVKTCKTWGICEAWDVMPCRVAESLPDYTIWYPTRQYSSFPTCIFNNMEQSSECSRWPRPLVLDHNKFPSHLTGNVPNIIWKKAAVYSDLERNGAGIAGVEVHGPPTYSWTSNI
jgi:hypothetical protein